MSIRDYFEKLLEVLEMRRQLLQQAIDTLRAIDATEGLQESVCRALELEPAAPIKPARAPKKPSGPAKTYTCEKCGREFPRSQSLGVHRKKCDGIQRTPEETKRKYQREWVRKNMKPKVTRVELEGGTANGATETQGIVPEEEAAPGEFESTFATIAKAPRSPVPQEFVFSKPVHCPKCSESNVRLRRRKNADLAKDYWVHVREGGQSCTLKIAHYSNIREDAKHQLEVV